MEVHPFPDLKVDSFDFLDELHGRSVCPNCKKSRKYYCYNCYVPVEGLQDRVPKIQLPVKIDVIKHPSECDGKSTAAHAGVVAPDHVSIYTYPVIPDFNDKERVILIFPGPESVALEELAKQGGPLNMYNTRLTNDCGGNSPSANQIQESESGGNSLTANQIPESEKTNQTLVIDSGIARLDQEPSLLIGDQDNLETDQSSLGCADDETNNEPPSKKQRIEKCVYRAPFDRVVFIDSTWNQTLKIYKDERLQGLKCVELKTRTTKFWRHQKDKPDTYLATIEAIYYFLRDYHEYFIPRPYRGEYDNLLFFFCFMYQKIRKFHDGGKHLKAYKNKNKMPQEVQT